MPSRILILLTASHRPINTPNVFDKNPLNREIEYERAFAFFSGLNFPILFIDNTNYISQNILNLGSKLRSFEYFKFQTENSYLGKGHGEKEILDFAFRNSKILHEAEYVVKISGRYRVLNLKNILISVGKEDVDVYINWGRDLSFADTRIMIFKKNFYEGYFSPLLEEYLNESGGVYFEKVFARSVHKLIAEGGKASLWPTYPFYDGRNGATGNRVYFSIFRKSLFFVFYKIKRWVFRQIV